VWFCSDFVCFKLWIGSFSPLIEVLDDVCSDGILLLRRCLGVMFAVMDVVLRGFLVVIDGWFVANQN
jgi:hypothetical protein